jgi:hypothetical protein
LRSEKLQARWKPLLASKKQAAMLWLAYGGGDVVRTRGQPLGLSVVTDWQLTRKWRP